MAQPLKQKTDLKALSLPLAHYKVPGDINVALLHTIITVTALRDVMIRENEALSQTKSAAFLEIQDEKVEVARRYEILVTSVMNRAEDIKKADEKLKAQLERLQESFGETARINRDLLERMGKATKMLGERLMKCAREEAEKQTQFAYGASGKMNRGGKALIGVDDIA